jgi:hypothetical protein
MLKLDLPVRPCKHKLPITLHEPAPDADCPIMQERIQDAVLDWMPRPFDADKPTFKAITTPCGHTFHAMALVYHWARNRNLLCPVCRAGDKDARLIMSRLPKEWKYSMAARVRREQRMDKNEKEEIDRQMAHAMAERNIPNAMPFSFKIRIESNFNSSWMMSTIPVVVMDYVIFDVPTSELALIPFTPDTKIRMLSLLYTPTGITTLYPPSEWFKAGENPGFNFSVRWDERGFHHIHFRMHDRQFAQMIEFALTS